MYKQTRDGFYRTFLTGGILYTNNYGIDIYTYNIPGLGVYMYVISVNFYYMRIITLKITELQDVGWGN